LISINAKNNPVRISAVSSKIFLGSLVCIKNKPTSNKPRLRGYPVESLELLAILDFFGEPSCDVLF